MSLLLLFCSYFQPDVNNLGLDQFYLRERWQARYSNSISALLLPLEQSNDPEIRYRVAAIRAKNLKWFSPVYWERVCHNRDFPAWVQAFVLDGDSLERTTEDIFLELHTDGWKANEFFKLAPAVNPIGERFLRGGIQPDEYDLFLEHIQYYRCEKVK